MPGVPGFLPAGLVYLVLILSKGESVFEGSQVTERFVVEAEDVLLLQFERDSLVLLKKGFQSRVGVA